MEVDGTKGAASANAGASSSTGDEQDVNIDMSLYSRQL